MPYPTAADLPGYLTRSCPGPTITLQDVTNAYNNASGDDISAFWAMLGSDEFMVKGFIESLGLDIAMNNYADIATLKADLQTVGGWYNADNPDPGIATLQAEINTDETNIGNNGTNITNLEAITTTLSGQVTTLSTQVTDLNNGDVPLTPTQIVDVFGELNPTQIAAIGVNFYSTGANCPKVEVQNDTDEETQPWLELVAGACLLSTIILHPGTETEEPPMENDHVYPPICDPDTGLPARADLVAPFLLNGTITQAPLWQALFDALTWLLRCCPPCSPQLWTYRGTTDGSVSVSVSPVLDAVKLNVGVEEFAIDTTFGHPETTVLPTNTGISHPPDPWQRLAQLRWIYLGGQKGEMMLWRFNNQVFRCPTGDVIGYEILSAPGLTYSFSERYMQGSLGLPTW